MSNTFFALHQELLEQAIHAIEKRGHWSPLAEMPSPKAYGEAANEDGRKAFEERLHKPFALSEPGDIGQTGNERSPYGMELGITYPKLDIDVLIPGVQEPSHAWRRATPEDWVGVALEARDLAAEAGVSLSCNLTDGVFVNQSAAYSDFHGTGANPAANGSLTDAAFVANRFRVAQSRAHV